MSSMFPVQLVLIGISYESELFLWRSPSSACAISDGRLRRPPVGFLLDIPCHLAMGLADQPSLFQ